MHWDSRWLWQGNTRDKQVWWWMNLTARWMVAAKLMLNSFWGKLAFRRWRRWMWHPGNVIGYHGIVEKRHCRNNWLQLHKLSHVPDVTQDPMVNLNSTADKTEGVSDNATKFIFCRWVWPHTKTIYDFMNDYLAWKAQGTLDKGCSWIGGPTGSGKTLVAAWQCRR